MPRRAGYADDEILIQQWHEILRLMGTHQAQGSHSLGSVWSAQLNSCSKQHALYQALKAFGQVMKSLLILRTPDPSL